MKKKILEPDRLVIHIPDCEKGRVTGTWYSTVRGLREEHLGCLAIKFIRESHVRVRGK